MPTCPAQGSYGCRSSRVGCCSDASQAHGHISRFQYRRHIGVSRIRIWLVLIDRRSPVNRDATQNEAKKDRHIQPVTPAHQEMVFPDDEHARLFRQRARRVRFTIGSVEWLIARPLLLGIGRRSCNDEKNLVRHKCSAWQLLSRRIDDIAGSECDLFRCDFHHWDI